jgi:SAM-dependent methyltransferase
LKGAVAFLRGSDPPDYGRRLSRLRWVRAARSSGFVEISPRDPASDALAGPEAWLFVRDEMALPWPLAKFPLAPPGRVLVAGEDPAAAAPAHTLRELETLPPAPPASDGVASPDPPALSFRVADFPPRESESVAQFLDRLLAGSVPRERRTEFRAFRFDDASELERPELTGRFPRDCRHLLDVGCGSGGASGALKGRLPALHVTGIERDEGAATRAKARLDRVVVGDADRVLERLALDGQKFDAFLFADVLEHLQDPVGALGRARELARPGATLVASVPNAGHLSLVRDLILGRFDPVPAGLVDAGHLRWFTRRSLHEALEEAGWKARAIVPWSAFPAPRAREFLSELSRWPALDRESLETYQWIAVADAGSAETQRRGGPGRASESEEEGTLLCALEAPVPQHVRVGAVNRFRGMALNSRGPIVRRVRLSIDGRGVGEFPVDRSSEDLARHLPRLPAARNCRFEFDAFVPAGAKIAEFVALAEDERAQPLFRMDLAEIQTSSARLEDMTKELRARPMPGPEIVSLTQGHRDVRAYEDSIIPGLLNARKYLARAGVDATSLTSVLDFGCGTGRILTGWHLDDPGRSLCGCDTNPALIEWARKNLPPSIRLDLTSPLPPLPYPDGAFDLVCAISVFTHLRFSTQELWGRELGRVIRPGGLALLTLHGKTYVDLFLPARLEEFERLGHLEIEGGEEGANESASFHHPSVVASLFPGFELIGSFPEGRIDGRRALHPLAALQDLYVLRRGD